jgi:WD40 repeat protein
LHATAELWALPQLTPLSSFHITSTVKSGGGDARSSTGGGALTGRIDLLAPFCGFVAATFSDSSRLAIYCLRTHAKHGQSTLPERARCMLADPRGRFLVLGSPTGWLRIYALQSGALVRAIRTHHDRGINCVQLDAEQGMLVLGGEDGVISVYDFAKLVQQAPLGGGSAAAAGGHNSTQSSALQQSALLLSISDHSLAITSLHISASNYLLSASKDGSVRVYRLEQALAAAPGGANGSAGGAGSGQAAPAPPCLFHYSFRSVVSSAVLDATESIIYAACKENVHWIPLYPSALALARGGGGGGGAGPAVNVHTWRGHQSTVTALLLPPSCSQLVSLDAEGHLKLWDAGAPAGASPPVQGSCIKTLARRSGCKNLACVDAFELVHGASRVATANTWLASHTQAKAASGLHGKDSGWIFPPLHAHPASPYLFVSVSVPPLSGQSHELVRVDSHAAKRRRRTFGTLGAASAEERMLLAESASEAAASSSSSDWSRAELALVRGTSGWSALAHASSSQGSAVEQLQHQLEDYAGNINDMYQLAVDKIWKDIKAPVAPAAAAAAAAPTSRAR